MSKLSAIAVVSVLWAGSVTFAGAPIDQHTGGVPALSSRPGASYTVYLDPAGFNFPGTWGGSTPGNNPAINGTTGTFTAADQTEIKAIYAAMANQYRSFNVNVTTVDPAPAGLTDAQRTAYYDSQARMMHTIIGAGGTPGWHTGADGLALGGTIDHVALNPGEHTNWMFTEAQDGSPTIENGNYIGNISSHETGHTFGLSHQGDYAAGVKVNEYSSGDTANGPGNYVPTMGDASNRTRVAWRSGPANNGSTNFQNDVQKISSNNGVTFVDSGIGHTFATATPVPLIGGSIDVNSAFQQGQINPLSASNPIPLGSANYTTDFFSFNSDGVNPVTFTLNDGNDLITPGTADNGITLRSLLKIFNASQTLVANVGEDSSTLFSSFNGVLGAGKYYAQVLSYGGHAEVSGFDAASYFDMGGYFITGSGFAVPEPTSLLFIAVAAYGMIGRRRA